LLYLIVVWFLNRHFKRVEFSNLKLLKRAAGKGFDWSKILKLLIVVSIATALAQPVKRQNHISKSVMGYDISLLLDASYSMREDSRFKIAKKIISKFIKERKNDNIALTLFANYAYVASPLTYQKEGILDMLNYINLGTVGGRNTALYEALFLGADIFKKSKKHNRVMILLTDGINTIDSVSLDSSIFRIKKAHIKVYTIALGKKGDFNKAVLQKIAKLTGGRFFQALKPSELDLIYNQIDSLEKGKIKAQSYTTYKHYFQIPLAIALVLIIIYGMLYRGTYSQILLILSAFFIVIALFRPTTLSSNFSKLEKKEFAIAFDLSHFMDAKDIYPNRLEFAKAKAKELIDSLSGQKVALFGFSNKAYLISPPTNDYERLKYLIENLDASVIKRDRANFSALIRAANKILKSNPKSVVVLSSGGVGTLEMAKRLAIDKSIKIYAYATASKKGDIIKVDNRVLKDSFGNILVSSLNGNFKKLAVATSGEFMQYSLSSDIALFAKSIGSSVVSSKEVKEGKKELFYLPLLAAFVLFVLSVASWRKKR